MAPVTPDECPTVQEIQVHLESFYATCRGSIPELAQQKDAWRLMVDYMGEDLVATVREFIPTVKLASVSYPATWWDAFKERWAPAWFLRRWPASYSTFDAAAFYPAMPIHLIRKHGVGCFLGLIKRGP